MTDFEHFETRELRLLAELSEAFGVSGFEEEIAATIERHARELTDDVWRDPLGSVYARRRGRRDDVLLLDAHMDEIGLIVQSIEPTGFLRFDTLGGWDERVMPAQAVEVQTSTGARLPGIIGAMAPHVQKPEDRRVPIALQAMFIDIGADSDAAAAALGVRVGDPAVLTGAGPRLLAGGRFAARNLDNRVGCTVALEVLRALHDAEPELTVVVSFPTTEEVGLRGATVAAREVRPRVALVLESTVAGDTPETPPHKQLTTQGAGPSITVADKRSIVPRRMVEFIERVAADEGIATQRKKPTYGGTDGGAIHISGGGVLTGCIAVPSRYIHSPNQQMLVRDFEQTIALAKAFTRRAGELIEETAP